MNNEFNFQPHTPDTAKKKNGFAIASLVLGIVSLLSSCCCTNGLGLAAMGIFSILAIVFAFVAKKNANGKMGKKAVAGLILGIVTIVIILLFAVAVMSVFTMTGTMPQDELLAFVEETYKPLFEGNEKTYNELVEAIKTIYAVRGQ